MKRLIILGAGLALFSGQIFPHAGNNSLLVIHSCVNKTLFIDRIVGVNGSCTSNEFAMHWSIAGPKGDQGERGAIGPAGPQGLQGLTGPQGSIGQTGATGATGSAGPVGPKGDNGANGTNGLNGKSAYELALDTGYVGPLNDWLVSLKGAKGDKGDPGEQGLPGLAGAVGAQGPKGDTGATGAQGLQGIAGLKGDAGPAGTDGAKGDKGDVGSSAFQIALAKGFQGDETQWLDSLKGDKGDTGAQGPEGMIGLQGPQGLPGLPGLAGAAGAKGDTGATGPAGVPGPAGPQGAKGDSGAQGATGPQGNPGATGASGVEIVEQYVCGTTHTDRCKVGSIGPGGGPVFFVDYHDQYAGFDYLEAAPADIVSTVGWCSTPISVPTATGWSVYGIGKGQANTTAILQICANGAAKLADSYISPNGTTDYFLPSIGELKLMYTNLLEAGMGSFNSELYWSSSLNTLGTALLVQFPFGNINVFPNFGGQSTIHAIRAF